MPYFFKLTDPTHVVKIGPNAKGSKWLKMDLNTKVNNDVHVLLEKARHGPLQVGDEFAFSMWSQSNTKSRPTQGPPQWSVKSVVYRIPKLVGEYTSVKFTKPAKFIMPTTAKLFHILLVSLTAVVPDEEDHFKEITIYPGGFEFELNRIQNSLTRLRSLAKLGGLVPK